MQPMPKPRNPLPACRFAGGVLMMVLVAVAMVPAAAAQDALYTVRGIDVTGKGPSRAAAKAAAIRAGEARAAQVLMQRLTEKPDHARLPTPDAATLERMIIGHSIARERATAKSYSARLTFRFRPAEVRRVLAAAGIAHVEGPGRPALLLAVWQQEDILVLWDDPNPWREAWRWVKKTGRYAKIQRPSGGLTDLRLISAKQAAAMDPQALTRIAARYKAGRVLVALARVRGPQVQINVRLFRVGAGRAARLGDYESANSRAALTRVAEKIIDDHDAAFRKTAIVPAGPLNKLTVRAPLQGLSYWVRLRESLGRLRLIRRQRILSLTPGMAVMEVSYAGRLDQLRAALQDQDIALVKAGIPGQDEVWEMRLRAGGAGSPRSARDENGDRRGDPRAPRDRRDRNDRDDRSGDPVRPRRPDRAE